MTELRKVDIISEPEDYFMEVVKGNITGDSPVYISGHDDSIGTTLATVGNTTGLLQTYSTIADVDSISSEDAGDAHDITIIGLDVDYNPVAPQTVTLNGQTRVAIPTPLFRILRIINLTATPTLGVVWAYVNTVIAAGKPVDTTKIRKMIAIIDPTGVAVSEETCSSATHTVAAGREAFVVFGKVTVSDAKAIEMSLWRRLVGGVFTLVRSIDIKDNNYDYFFKIPAKLPEKTDLEVRAKVDSGTAHVSAAIDMIERVTT